MIISQRQINLWLIGLMTVGSLVLSLGLFLTSSSLIEMYTCILAVFIFGGLLVAYRRGWEQARYVVVVITMLLAAFATQEPYVSERFSVVIFVPPTLALIVANPLWVIGSAVFTVIALIMRAGGVGIYTEPVNLALYAITIGGLILSRLVTESAQRIAEQNAERAEQHAYRTEQQAHEVTQQAAELAQKNAELAQINDQQRRLLDLVVTLETPAVILAEGVLLAPIVGHLDSRRAQALITRLLHEVSEQRARLVVIDIAGVATVDTEVAHALLRAAQALRLLGCQVTITGISVAVAATLTHLNISLQDVTTARSPQEALAQYAAQAGTINGSAPGNGKTRQQHDAAIQRRRVHPARS